MKRNLLKFVILVFAIMAISSCQKEEDDDTITLSTSTDEDEEAFSDDNTRHCTSKPAIIAKVGKVYVLSVNEDGEEVFLAHPDCGACVIWPRKGNEYNDITLIHTNNPDVVQRVRLVRDLEKW